MKKNILTFIVYLIAAALGFIFVLLLIGCEDKPEPQPDYRIIQVDPGPLPVYSPLIDNPSFIYPSPLCPWGYSSWDSCMLPPPWFCYPVVPVMNSTADGWNFCDTTIMQGGTGMDMPVNWMGDFSPLSSMVGININFPPESLHPPEWFGTPLVKPVMPGCTMVVSMVIMPSPSHRWVGEFHLVCGGDTANVQPAPFARWQTIHDTLFPQVMDDTLLIGGETGNKLFRSGPANSSYHCFGYIGAKTTKCF